ncbi:MAG: hypothetical protein FWH01_09300 [Oscillospiraceae bacterium]|nr:hypothetical protein [Oscillospiraceae bacterium]
MRITDKERKILRELAVRQAEIAALPIMEERKKLWYDINDGKTGHPLVAMEFHGLEQEVYPKLMCEDPLARELERDMSQLIFRHEHYRDDFVIPASVSVGIHNDITPFGFNPDVVHTMEADGTEGLGYVYKYIVDDLEKDIGLFKPSSFVVDAGLKEANERKVHAEEILGDILPVRLEFRGISLHPAFFMFRMMGMETMFCSIIDYPELFHKIMRQLTDDYHAFLDAIEAGGALVPNNDASRVCQETAGYTHELPGAGQLDRPMKISDSWGMASSQETVGMSAAMYDEFFFTYTKEITDRCGLLSYGCCEPVDMYWESSLSRLKNLRRLSISPWCNEEAIGEMIRGTKVCYHRKPSPNYISVDSVFDEEAFLNHIKRSVIAARGCPLHITFRDITSVRGEPWRLTRAVELTREAFARWWQG